MLQGGGAREEMQLRASTVCVYCHLLVQGKGRCVGGKSCMNEAGVGPGLVL